MKTLDTVLAKFFIKMDNNFGITGRSKSMSLRLQLLTQITIVVNFTVKHDPNRLVLIRDRLLARLQIDDAQSPHPDSHLTLNAVTKVIRSSVDECVAHRTDQF